VFVIQESTQSILQILSVAELALPDDQNGPALCYQIMQYLSVPAAIPFQLFLPELPVALWYRRFSATGMLMPKASVHKDNLTMSWEHDIGISRERPYMQTETESHSVNFRPHRSFGGGILLPNGTHHR